MTGASGYLGQFLLDALLLASRTNDFFPAGTYSTIPDGIAEGSYCGSPILFKDDWQYDVHLSSYAVRIDYNARLEFGYAMIVFSICIKCS